MISNPLVVLIIEDHPIVRAGCRRILQSRDNTEVLEAATGAEGLRLNAERLPAVIILDLKLPDASGLDLLRQMLERNPEAKILIFSTYDDPTFASHAMEAGAAGYVTKNDDPDLILIALEKICGGQVYLSHSVAHKLAMFNLKPNPNPVERLSARELEVLRLLGQGNSLSEIAYQMDVSYRTAASIASNIRQKLNIGTMYSLVKFAVDLGPPKPANTLE